MGKKFTLGDIFRLGRSEDIDAEALDGLELAVVEGPASGTLAPAPAEGNGRSPQAITALTAKERELAVREAKLDAREYIAGLGGKLSPHEVEGVTSAYVLAFVDDIERPITDPFTDKPVKRVDLLKRSNAHRAGFKGDALASGEEAIGDEDVLRPGEKALPSVPPGGAVQSTQDDIFALAATTQAGLVALKESPEGRAWCQSRGL